MFKEGGATELEVWTLNAGATALNALASAMSQDALIWLIVVLLTLSGAAFSILAVVRINIFLWKRSRLGYVLTAGLLAWSNPKWPNWSGAADFFAFAGFGVVLMVFYVRKAVLLKRRYRPKAN